jgi:quinol monooxygenase YgiN
VIIIAGSMSFAAADRVEVLMSLAEVTAASRRDAGCVEYWWAEDVEHPNTFSFYECWESKELLDSHLAQPHEAVFADRNFGRMTAASASMFEATALSPG